MENHNLKSQIAIEIKKLNWLIQNPEIETEQLRAVLFALQEIESLLKKKI